MLALLPLTFVAAAATILSSNVSPPYKLVSFIKDVQKQEQFRSFLIFQKSSDLFHGDFVNDIYVDLDIPVILISDNTSFYVKDSFNSELLAIVHLESITDEDTLRQLLESLHHIRSSKTIFLLDYPSKDELILRDLFNFCWQNHMINVLAIFQDFSNTATFFRYTNMPTFMIEESLWTNGPPLANYFPNRMQNLKGRELPVIFGGSEPKMIIPENDKIAGYAGHVFLALAKKHNAGLNAPKINKALAARKLVDLVYNGTVEISAATVFLDPLDWCSYPYESFDWCVMLPIEPSIPTYEIFFDFFDSQTLFTILGIIVVSSALLESSVYLLGRKTSFMNYFFQDSCFRGCFGQSFIQIPRATYTIKIIYLIVCLTGIMLVTLYNAFLQTYIYSPPSEKKISTFDELLASGKKVFGLSSEFTFLTGLEPRFQKEYKDLFLFESDFAKYVKFRDSFNTSFSYMVNSPKWVILQEQQKFSGQPLFRFSKDMCFLTSMPMAFPINENSIYKEILNFLILETYSSGLIDFWKRLAFNELIEIGEIELFNFPWKPDYVPLTVEDFQLIWVAMGVSFLVSILCFIGEILRFKWNTYRGG